VNKKSLTILKLLDLPLITIQAQIVYVYRFSELKNDRFLLNIT